MDHHLRVAVVTGLHSSRMSLQVSGIADEAALRRWIVSIQIYQEPYALTYPIHTYTYYYLYPQIYVKVIINNL